MYICIWPNLCHVHTHPSSVSLSATCLTLFRPLFLSSQDIHSHICAVQYYCASMSVYLCVFALCMCVGSGTQCFILGLNQVSAPEDCRLMWPISSDYSCMVTVSQTHTCIHMHSVTRKNHSKEKPQDVVYTFVCFSKKDIVYF